MIDQIRIVGIDLATESKRTGVVLLDVSEGIASASLPPSGFIANDDGLKHLVDSTTIVGLDAPLGWPTEFVEAMVQHDGFNGWPNPSGLNEIELRRLLCRRRTDREVHAQVGLTPLSVSANLLGAVAMRGAVLQFLWSQAWVRFEPRDGSGRLIETYPAATMQQWKLKSEGKYKGGSSPEKKEEQRKCRGQILQNIVDQSSPWLTLGAVKQKAIDSDHVLDGLLCALTALAVVVNATHHLGLLKVLMSGEIASFTPPSTLRQVPQTQLA